MKTLHSALLVIALSGPATAEPVRCVSPEQGRDLIQSSRVRPFPEAAQRAGIDGSLMEDVQLCHSDGRFRYEVDVLKQ